jgi:hypothetical protein
VGVQLCVSTPDKFCDWLTLLHGYTLQSCSSYKKLAFVSVVTNKLKLKTLKPICIIYSGCYQHFVLCVIFRPLVTTPTVAQSLGGYEGLEFPD